MRQLVLDREDALQFSVVRLGPQVVSVRGVDQLGGEPQRVAFAPDAPLQHGGDGELLSDLADAEVLVLVGERRSARDDPEPVDVGERVDHFLGDSVRKVLVVLRRAHVHERKDRDRRARRRRAGGRGPARAREVPRHRWHDREDGDRADGKRQRQTSQTRGPEWKRPLDASGRHVEYPGEREDHREPDGERDHHERKRPVREAEPVHDRLDHLEDGERHDGVPDQRAEDAPSLELRDQRHRHRASV